MSYDYDLFVIGGGSGGVATARRAAQYGAKVGLAEVDRLGGTCVNRGCIPKKLMVYASHFPDLTQDAKGYGWQMKQRPVEESGVQGLAQKLFPLKNNELEMTLDWSAMLRTINQELERLNGVYQRMLDNSKVDVLRDYAAFVDEHTLSVGDRKVTADKILIAVGGKPVKPDIPGIEYAITSDDIFHLPKQPKRIMILGGGYIGCEFACILQGLGTEVTQVIRGDLILKGFDGDLRSTIQEAMQQHGIRLLTDSLLTQIEKTDEGLIARIKGQENSEETVVTDAVSLAATGREPNLENLGLDKTGVEVRNGAIAVDENNRTAVENIYAVGDCIGRIELTPVAIKEGRFFADTIFGNTPKTMSYDNVPTAIFTTPEAATVGLTEAEAKEQYGDAVKIYRAKFRPTYFTLAGRDEKTLVKLVVETNTDRVVGAHMVGDNAAEIIQGLAIAVKMGAKKSDFDATVAIHPSVAEEFVTLR
ncbi:glutathione-disulfide reductase [Lusitaniella coriacea LEGE 07157]|uniref:Glutathione-disulfide reductase n=1 Tax=Lusitaniella coriacea LEGE 07157 TaxID=945747 RepID=A0A8J7DZB9_9CYAN|nr:glutathione-disulfide reductase [Lusitaniella coriacea]MBE9118371.1 glutathione-disulfide reductase [Lusitaniella coriacea LEGE 07157]